MTISINRQPLKTRDLDVIIYGTRINGILQADDPGYRER